MPQKTISLLEHEVANFAKILKAYEAIPAKEAFILVRARVGESVATLYHSGKLLIQGDDCEQVYKKLTASLPSSSLAIGIDETGRGEDYGPLVVAGVLGSRNDFRELRDSKKTSDISSAYQIVAKKAKKIEAVEINSKEIDRLRTAGTNLNLIQIDAILQIIAKLRQDESVQVLIDGSKLPVNSPNIIFIPGGDDKDPLISAASIVARHIREKSKDYGKRHTWKSQGQ